MFLNYRLVFFAGLSQVFFQVRFLVFPLVDLRMKVGDFVSILGQELLVAIF